MYALGCGDVDIGIVQPDVITKSARTRVDSADLSLLAFKVVLELTCIVRRDNDMVLFKELLKLLEGHVVLNKTGFHKLVLFSDTRRENDYFILPLQILFDIYHRTHDRTVYRREVFQQLWLICFYIFYDSRTWLCYDVADSFFLDSTQVRPCTDICTEGYVIYKLSLFSEPVEDTLPLIREGRFDSWRCKDYHLLLAHCCQCLLGIINIISCMVSAVADTLTAGDTAFRVYCCNKSSVLKHLGDISLGCRTGSDAGITAHAFFRFNNNELFHYIRSSHDFDDIGSERSKAEFPTYSFRHTISTITHCLHFVNSCANEIILSFKTLKRRRYAVYRICAYGSSEHLNKKRHKIYTNITVILVKYAPSVLFCLHICAENTKKAALVRLSVVYWSAVICSNSSSPVWVVHRIPFIPSFFAASTFFCVSSMNTHCLGSSEYLWQSRRYISGSGFVMCSKQENTPPSVNEINSSAQGAACIRYEK